MTKKKIHLTSMPQRHHHWTGTIERFGDYYKVRLVPNFWYIIAGPTIPTTHTWTENFMGLTIECHCPEGVPE